MQALLSVALIVVVSPLAVSCQDAAKPIPADWLHNGRLVVAGLNFSVSSPPNTQWSYSVGPYGGSKVTTFIGIDASNLTVMPYIVAVVDRSFDDLGSKMSFVDEMQKGLPDWKVQDVQFEQTDIPINGSARFRAKCDGPGEPFGIAGRVTLYQYGYVLSGKLSYMLYYLTPEAAEPAHFSHFAASFALISPSANARQSDNSRYTVLGGVVTFVLAVGFVVCLVVWAIKHFGAKRVSVTELRQKIAASLDVAQPEDSELYKTTLEPSINLLEAKYGKKIPVTEIPGLQRLLRTEMAELQVQRQEIINREAKAGRTIDIEELRQILLQHSAAAYTGSDRVACAMQIDKFLASLAAEYGSHIPIDNAYKVIQEFETGLLH